MYLWHLFTVKPMAALSILLCLATIFSCVVLQRRKPRLGADRFLVAFLGVLSIYQGLRILQSAGIVAHAPNETLNDVIEVSVTAFYLLATVVLRLSASDHLQAQSAIRLLSAAPPRSQLRNPEVERDLARLSWALPRLSDGAFRLYAYLCLRQDSPTGRSTVAPGDVRLHLGKTKEQIDRDLAELVKSGAVYVNRDGGKMGITIVAQPSPSFLPVADPSPASHEPLPETAA